MSAEERRPAPASESQSGSSPAHLSSKDLSRLTAFKLRYSLEAHGFSTAQASRLLFIQWLYRSGAVGS